MRSSWLTRGAVTAERNRSYMAKTGVTMSGERVWSEEEVAKLRRLYPLFTYKELVKYFDGRTWNAIRSRAQILGLTKRRHVWTAAEISRLRRIYPTGSTDEIRAAFPGFDLRHIRVIANYHGLFRKRRPFRHIGIPAIDQIRARAFELGYSMVDVDIMARSKRYFQQGGWYSGHVHHRAIARAIKALDGAVSAEWKE